MKSSFIVSFTIINIFILCVHARFYVRDHEEHILIDPDPMMLNATSISVESTNVDASSYGWLWVGISFLGTIIGGLVPLFDYFHEKAESSESGAKSKWATFIQNNTVKISSPTFISAALGFSAGALVYGSLGLILPQSIQLLSQKFPKTSGLLVLGMWIGGVLFMAGFRMIEVFIYRKFASTTLHIDSSTRCSSPFKTPSQTFEKEEEIELGESGAHVREVTENTSLKNLGVATAIALALHKIPEGIVTYTTAVSDPEFGALLGIAMFIHNIPEAFATSIPIYKATGSFWKSFLAPLIIGAMQPVGAAIGFALLAGGGFSDFAQGMVYSPISGFLSYIAVRGLWTSALGFEQKTKKKSENGAWVSLWFFVGVTIMLFSISLSNLV